MSDDFTPEEQEALGAWSAPALRDDLASRVLSEALTETPAEETPKTSPRRKRWWALAAGAAAAMAIALLLDQSASGRLDAVERTSTKLGKRGVLVAESGSSLHWIVTSRGDARVQQDRGNVFYRVERGGPFVVKAGDTTVRVLGTSFRVEVSNVKTKNAMAVGATAGALVATAVVVTVYEGRVDAASPTGTIELSAGEAAMLRPGEAPVRRGATLSSARSPKTAAAIAGERAQEALAKIPEDAAPIEVRRALAAARAENQQLQEALAKATEALGEAPKRSNRTYDLDDATLQRMAEKCSLAWDMVSTGVEPPRVPDDAADRLSLSMDEREVIDRKFADSHAELTKVIRETYTAVTGDTNTGSLATEAMFFEIRDKSNRDEMRVVFQRLARERAGLQPPPADLSGASPLERMFRVVTSSGDRLEDAIASELGHEQARKVRDANGGWNNRSRSSHGCPK